ncbi:MAG: hypothetical protein N2745_11640, partial [Syntrophorhabdaceae bacterium]|nr:hypothetical protein [Syntrophorhabdaceae bacterium]
MNKTSSVKGSKGAYFIDEELIADLLKKGEDAEKEEVLEIIEKGREAKGLTPLETAILLQKATDDEASNALFSAAREVKERIYGKRLVFFA